MTTQPLTTSVMDEITNIGAGRRWINRITFSEEGWRDIQGELQGHTAAHEFYEIPITKLPHQTERFIVEVK